MESFLDRMSTFVLPTCFITLDQSDAVTYMLLADVFKLILTIFDGEKELHYTEARHFRNPTMCKSSEVEDCRG